MKKLNDEKQLVADLQGQVAQMREENKYLMNEQKLRADQYKLRSEIQPDLVSLLGEVFGIKEKYQLSLLNMKQDLD